MFRRFLLSWRGDILSEAVAEIGTLRAQLRIVETAAARDLRVAEAERDVAQRRLAEELLRGERLHARAEKFRAEAAFWCRAAGDASRIILHLRRGDEAGRPDPVVVLIGQRGPSDRPVAVPVA